MTESVSRKSDCFTHDIKLQLEAKARGDRKIIRHGGTLCCKCHAEPPISAKSRYCKKCRSKYMAAWRDRLKAIHDRNAAIAEGVAAVLAGTNNNNRLSKGNENEPACKGGPLPASRS